MCSKAKIALLFLLFMTMQTLHADSMCAVAGYVFSASTAAIAYKTLTQKYKTDAKPSFYL
jgi:hypothetical protein